jgi:hypothetical protein
MTKSTWLGLVKYTPLCRNEDGVSCQLPWGADKLDITEICTAQGGCILGVIFKTDNRAIAGFDVTGDYSRSYLPVPGLKEICMGWEKPRGHFLFDGQRQR